MATIPQIQKGFIRFIDLHIAGAFDGWQRAIVVGGATLVGANLPALIKTYAAHPVVSALGVYNPVSESVDIDALYSAFVPNMGSDKLPVTIPKIGTIRIGKEEIDCLVKYIKEA